MADNVAVTEGSGKTIATDDVGGVQYQRVKLNWGPDATANEADVASGKPIPMQLRGSDGTDRSNLLPVSLASGTVASGAVASGAFASGALASGSVASGAIASGAIAAGAIAAGATSIADNEDVASADGDRGVKVLFKRLDTPANSSGTDGDYEQPQMSGGRLWVDASGKSLTVASHAVTNAGTFATQVDGAALTALQLIDNIVNTEDNASSTGDSGVVIFAKRGDTPAATSGTDGDYEPLQVSNGLLWVNPLSYFATCTTDVTRPSDTTTYTANDSISNSTSAPTSGGFTFTNAARKSGGSGIITDIYFLSTAVPATLLQGELWIFDQAVTNTNDNAAFVLSDADAKFTVGMVPFTLVANAANSSYHAQNLNIGFTCVGTANLRYLLKAKNAYVPVSAEVLTIRAKTIGID